MGKTDGTSPLKPEPDRRYTLEEWRSWPDDERWELIDGYAYAMSPSPTVLHQEMTLEFGRQLGNSLQGKPWRPFTAPLDVFEGERYAPLQEFRRGEEAKSVVLKGFSWTCGQR